MPIARQYFPASSPTLEIDALLDFLADERSKISAGIDASDLADEQL
jgi:hypothetical protein